MLSDTAMQHLLTRRQLVCEKADCRALLAVLFSKSSKDKIILEKHSLPLLEE